jgi:hypothetical protein
VLLAGIMCNGRLHALGSPQSLKNQHGAQVRNRLRFSFSVFFLGFIGSTKALICQDRLRIRNVRKVQNRQLFAQYTLEIKTENNGAGSAVAAYVGATHPTAELIERHGDSLR